MAAVTVELPSLLAPLVDAAEVPLEAETVAEALRTLVERHPALRVHVFDDRGGLRRHVLCFHNGANTRWEDASSAPLADRDRLRILQAVSGG